jgi:enamine deaminase RidA (YjgF/YER057c/UK114 family)
MTTSAPVQAGIVTRINPTSWNAGFAFDQGQVRDAPARVLTVAGQGPVDKDGQLLHEGDAAAQIALAMTNVEAVLTAGGMDFRDVLQMRIYAVDVDAILSSYGVFVERLTVSGATPPTSLVGVSRLAIPGMLLEIEVSAGR